MMDARASTSNALPTTPRVHNHSKSSKTEIRLIINAFLNRKQTVQMQALFQPKFNSIQHTTMKYKIEY